MSKLITEIAKRCSKIVSSFGGSVDIGSMKSRIFPAEGTGSTGYNDQFKVEWLSSHLTLGIDAYNRPTLVFAMNDYSWDWDYNSNETKTLEASAFTLFQRYESQPDPLVGPTLNLPPIYEWIDEIEEQLVHHIKEYGLAPKELLKGKLPSLKQTKKSALTELHTAKSCIIETTLLGNGKTLVKALS